jgi:hypothetical protein
VTPASDPLTQKFAGSPAVTVGSATARDDQNIRAVSVGIAAGATTGGAPGSVYRASQLRVT